MNFDEFMQKECPTLVPSTLPHGLTMAELETEFGTDPQWGKIKADPRWRSHLAETLHSRRLRQAGQIPPSYTAPRECKGCGPVLLETWTPEKVAGCPWCFNRVKGLPIPRPEMVS